MILYQLPHISPPGWQIARCKFKIGEGNIVQGGYGNRVIYQIRDLWNQ